MTLLLLVLACSTTPVAAPPPPTVVEPPPTVVEPAPPPAPAPAPAPAPPPLTPPPIDNTPIACKVDADCPSLSCGPCNAGDKITQQITHVNCFRNPCPGQVAVCSPERVCVARDTLSMSPR